MPRLLACLDCGELSSGSRCPRHRREFERKRKEAEPWRHLYNNPAWARCVASVLQRDEYRCTYTQEGRRCANTDLLEAHHEEKLRVIWKRCGEPQRGTQGWTRFVKDATDPRRVHSMCPRCHKFVDDNPFLDTERGRVHVGHQGPTPHRGTSASRRRGQHGRRQRARKQRKP